MIRPWLRTTKLTKLEEQLKNVIAENELLKERIKSHTDDVLQAKYKKIAIARDFRKEIGDCKVKLTEAYTAKTQLQETNAIITDALSNQAAKCDAMQKELEETKATLALAQKKQRDTEALLAKELTISGSLRKQVASMKSADKASSVQLKMISDTVDLTDENEAESSPIRLQRPSNLAIMYGYHQQLEKVKREKNDTETSLHAAKEKLEDVKDDLAIANETIVQQLLATDSWQTRFDDLAKRGNVDEAVVAEIRNRSLGQR